MDNLITCLTQGHEKSAVAAAAFVTLIGSYLTLRLGERARVNPPAQQWIWLCLSGLSGGMMIWCAHFISMLGYILPFPPSYDPVLTFLSLASAVSTTTLASYIVLRSEGSLLVEAGGAVFGLGIALMHFIGMAGFNVPGTFVWSLPYIAASLLGGALFGILATTLFVRRPVRYGVALSCLMCCAAVFMVHYVSIAGLSIVPREAVGVPKGLEPQTMLFFTIQAASMVVILGLAVLVLDVKNGENVRAEVFRARVHDPLTGLPNRSAFSAMLSDRLGKDRSGSNAFALAFLDIHGFKEINDVRGHAAGDFILGLVASRIVSGLAGEVFLARIGNDEFAVFLDGRRSRSDILHVLQEVIREIEKPVGWGGELFEVKTDIGVVFFPSDGRRSEELIARADVALQRAKRSGENAIAFYEEGRDHGERRLNALALDMRRALEDGEFQLYYQQQHLTDDRTIFGFEVLLRWFHRENGFIPPDEFIPLSERTGFIGTLGEWVLREACADAVTWKNPLQIGVNVSPQQLADPHLSEKVAAILKETGLPPQRLELEITESGIIDDAPRAHACIDALKALGVKIAMDDFGTGYSSLAMLQQFPFDKIKIDRSFIAGLPDDELSAAICRSTVIISKSLGIRVLAEGVETEEQLEFLKREECARAQGYYFGRPKPRSEIEAFVNGNMPETG